MKLKFKSITNLIAKFTPLALLAGVYLSTSALPAVAAQSWVRFTYVKKYPAQGTQDVSVLALARFALFDVGGNCLIPDAGLTKGSSATALGVNEFWQNMGDSNAGNLFTSGMTSGTKWSRNSATLPVVWTMRLADNVVPVQYNLAVADVTVTTGKTDLLGRYPTSWTVETSTTGADGSWTTVSTVNDVTPPSTASSWYNDGGKGTTPSTFYPLATSSTYTPITYINAQTRGPALRISGFHLQADDYVETKVLFNDMLTGGGVNIHTVFCNRQGANAVNSFSSFVNAGKLRFDYGPTAGSSDYSDEALLKDVEYVIKGDGSSDKKLTAISGSTTVATAKATGKEIGAILTSDLLLFAHNAYSGSGTNWDAPQTSDTSSLARMKMYYFKVYDDSTKTTLRLDLVPVKNSNGVVGMYDRVSGNFYSSVTGDEFTAGPELPSFLGQLVLDPRNVAAGADERATGGDIILQEGDDYIHVFYDTTAEQTFTVNQNSTVRILAVGGGGAGGAQGGPNGRSGGGGAGGYVEQSNVALQTGDYTLQVGAGGSAVTYKYGEDRQGVSGQSSWLKRGDAFVEPEALGGGGGGAGSLPGLPGGSGGGGAYSAGGGSGTTGQGYAGGGSTSPNNQGSGGGGAAGAGVRVGGAAKASDILGTEYAFAGGGGGANLYTGTEYKGGGATISGETVYVGGSGGTSSNGENGKAGVAGTGSGGGGSARNAGGDSIHSGAGGSGIVIIRVTSGSPVGPTPVSDLTVEFSAASYTGSTIDPTITIKNGSTTVASGTASAINSGSYDLTVAWPSGVTIKNAGDYTLTVTGGGTTYTGSKTATFTVAKFLLTPSATATSTYTGTTQDCPDQTVSGKSLKGLSTMGNGQRTPCGTQTVKFTLNDTANYTFPNNATVFNVSWTINKGNNSWTQVPAISTPTWSIYGGQGTLTPGKVKWGTLDYKGNATAAVAPATWTKDGVSQGPFSGTLPTEKGVYTITYTCPTSKSLQSSLNECWNLPSPVSYTISFEIVDRLNDITPPHFSSARTFKCDGATKSVTLAGFDSNTMTKESSSVESATAAGIYKVYVTPKSGNCWSDTKSTATRALEWGIVPSGYADDRNFLNTLANHPNKVSGGALPTGISGGDIVLRFPNRVNGETVSHDYVHIFTNPVAAATFENASGLPRQGRALIVGGGGAGGTSSRSAWDIGKIGGGGGGGGVISRPDFSFEGAYDVVVGKGSAAAGTGGSNSSIVGADISLVAFGGGYGGSGNSSTGNGGAGGCGGGSAFSSSSAAGTPGASLDASQGGDGFSAYLDGNNWMRGGAGGGAGLEQGANRRIGGYGFVSDILTDGMTYHCFGGGGSSGIHENNGGGTDGNVAFPIGGGGCTRSEASYYSAQLIYPAVPGLGAGGMGQNANYAMRDPKGDVRGSSGIVVIRYTDDTRLKQIKTVAVPRGLLYDRPYNFNTYSTGLVDTDDYTVEGQLEGRDIGTYTVTLKLKYPDDSEWDDGTDQPQVLTWRIVPEVPISSDFYLTLCSNSNRVESDILQMGAPIVFRWKETDAVSGQEYNHYVNIFTDCVNNVEFALKEALPNVDILLIGGGGGGGAGARTYNAGGGGGAGGYRLVSSASLVAGNYSVAVGGGGAPGSIGESSSIEGPNGFTALIVGGGGKGGSVGNAGGSADAQVGGSGGGSGGGHGDKTSGTAGPYGRNGGSGWADKGAGGGGGGAGANGGNANNWTDYTGNKGGNGLSNEILGYPEWFAGGGGGGAGPQAGGQMTPGGKGGGGSAVARRNTGTPGENGQGGGGAGASEGNGGTPPNPTRGGDGIVIIAYTALSGSVVAKPQMNTTVCRYDGHEFDAREFLDSKLNLAFSGTYTATDAGTYTFEVSPAPGYHWLGTEEEDEEARDPVVFSWTIEPRVMADFVAFSAIGPQTYSGQDITPAVTLTDATWNGGIGKTLVSGTDYTLEYINNRNIGTATVKATGKGNYTGAMSTTFQIVNDPTVTGYYVTPEGGGDGTGWASPCTLTEAVGKISSAAQAKVAIYMKEGDYSSIGALTVSASSKQVSILGGYKGENMTIVSGGQSVLAGGSLTITAGQAVALSRLTFAGCAVSKSGSAALTAEHCAFRGITGYALSVTAGSVTVASCSFSGNSSGSLSVDSGVTATVRNSILYSKTSGGEISGSGTLTLDHVLLSGAHSGGTQTGVITGDPLFASATDLHLKSSGGRYLNGAWQTDGESSPAIDAGEGSYNGEFANDEGQNFGLNLGVYGNTQQASKSPVRTAATVTFNDGEGTGGPRQLSGWAGFPMPPSVSTPARAKFNFGGYFTGENGTGDKYYNADGSLVAGRTYPIGVTTLYAQWEENIHYIERPTQGMASWTYDGQDHRPTYAETDGYTVAYSAAAPWKNASTYTVTFTLKDNCEWADGDDRTSPIVFTYTIAKASLYVVPDDKTIAYGDAKPTLTYHLEGFVNGEDAESAEVQGDPLLQVTYSPGDACGTYDIMSSNGFFGSMSAPNYDVSFRKGKLTVTQRVATLSWANLSFVYDGTAKVPTCTIGNLYDSDAVSATVAVDDGPAIQPGTYTARVTGLTGDKAANYSLPATVTTSFTIVSESVILDDNGGAEGEGSVRLIDGTLEKATVTRPFYNGYSFRGYWTALDGGSQVYDQTGTLVANPPTLASGDTLYAHWEFVETYYLVRKDGSSGPIQAFEATPTPGANGAGWAETPTGNPVRHTVCAEHKYVASQTLGTPEDLTAAVHEFAGDELKISNWLGIFENVSFKKLISQGGQLCNYKTVAGSVTEFSVGGEIEIVSGSQLVVVMAGANRHLNVTANISGGENTLIKFRSQANVSGAKVVFSGDASGFNGKLQLYDDDFANPFGLYFTDSFGGSVDTLPTKAENVWFNHGDLTDGTTKGLPISSTTIPARVKDSITFFGSSNFTAANFPLMTFPEGTTVNLADFTVYHATEVDGTKMPFTNLGKVVNSDTTITLVANVQMIAKPTAVTGLVYNGNVQTGVAEGEGYTLTGNTGTDATSYTATATLQAGYVWDDGTTAAASVPWSIAKATNAWAPTPALSATTFAANRPASITWGVAQFGGDATATLDGRSFTKAGTLPANLSVGEHTLVFTVEETSNYTGLSETLVFTVTDALYDLHAITKDGPTVKGVPSSWLSAAFPGVADYQDAFLSTNVNGVTGWAAYILGFEGGDVPTAAIIEQATESAMSDGKVMLTVALPDLPTAREVEGCTVAYSLLTSDNAETLRTGGGDVVDGCLKISSSSFTVPLSIPTDANHVYYRIRIHFIFGGGDDPLDRTGYVRVSFNSTTSNNLNYLELNFKDEEGNYVSHPDVVSSGKEVIAYYCAFDGFNAGNNIPYETVYVAPPGAVLGDTEVEYYPSGATKNVVPGATATYANMSLTAVNAETAMVECDKIWKEITGGDLTLWNGLVETFITDRKSDKEWTRGLTKLQAALQPNSTTPCRILLLGDSLSADFYYGCINAMIEAAYNTTNVSITCQQNNNHGCYEYVHSGDYIDGQTQKDCFYRLHHIDFNHFDLVMFAGTTQLRGHIGTTGEDAVEAVKKYITGEAADGGAGARANADCEFIMVSPLISVDSRLDYGKKYGDDGTCYWGTPQAGGFVYWNSVAAFNHCGQGIEPRDDWDYTQDPWMNQDYNQSGDGLSRMRNKCLNNGIAYWDLTQLCYQYLYRSGKPFAYFNRDSQHSNRYGKQFAARVVFEVIKMICPRPQP